MNREEVKCCIARLGILINDWRNAKSPAVTEIAEEIIIDKAAELLEVARPQKSETACNCDEEFLKEFIDAMNSVANILGHMTETQKNALASILVEQVSAKVGAVPKLYEIIGAAKAR